MKCLIVDDSKMSRMMLKKILSTAHPDWELTEACDSQDAINKAKEQNWILFYLITICQS